MTVLHSEAPKVAQPDFGVFHRVADDKPVEALAPVTPAGLRRGCHCPPGGTPRACGQIDCGSAGLIGRGCFRIAEYGQ